MTGVLQSRIEGSKVLRELAAAVALLVVMSGFMTVSGNQPAPLANSEVGRWFELAVGPTGGAGTGMAYDSQSGRSVLVTRGETFTLNRTSSKWVRLESSPHPEDGGLIAYDSKSDRIVLFGGASGRETWILDVDTGSWANNTPALTPGVHRRGSLAYDSQSDRTVLFGGGGAAGMTNDTWSYDLNTNTWTEMNPVVSPAPRFLAAMAYDAGSDRVVMCGGLTNNGLGSEGWTYDLEGNTWTSVSGFACGLYGHAMAYDSQRDRLVIFAGGWFGPSDTLVYDSPTQTWTLLNRTARPMGRLESSIAYDSVADKLIMFGGVGGPSLDDSWAYDFPTDRWNLVSWGTPEYNLHGLAYDEQSDRTILAAGIGCGDRTWAYDFQADAWTNMMPDRGYGTGSPTRAVVYDSSLDRVICFDGRTLAYDFDTNTWADMNVRPPSTLTYPGQSGFAMAYDKESDRIILTGGASGFGEPMNGTWAFDSAVWRNMNPKPSLPGRSSCAMAYDAESDRIIVFGGRGNSYTTLGDTWAYDYNENRWTNMSPNNGPSARAFAAAAYDDQSDRIILFGGTNATGWPLNETWAYDFNTNTWTNLTSSVNPSWRASGHSMAYDSRADRIILFGGSPPKALNTLTWGFELGTVSRTLSSPVVLWDLTYVVVAIVASVILFATVLLLHAWRRSKSPPTS